MAIADKNRAETSGALSFPRKEGDKKSISYGKRDARESTRKVGSCKPSMKTEATHPELEASYTSETAELQIES